MFSRIAPIALLAPPTGALAQKGTPANVTADLPAGAMQAKATTACLEMSRSAHHPAAAPQQGCFGPRKWNQMTKWGAVVDPRIAML